MVVAYRQFGAVKFAVDGYRGIKAVDADDVAIFVTAVRVAFCQYRVFHDFFQRRLRLQGWQCRAKPFRQFFAVFAGYAQIPAGIAVCQPAFGIGFQMFVEVGADGALVLSQFFTADFCNRDVCYAEQPAPLAKLPLKPLRHGLVQPHQRLADDLQLVFFISLADADAEALRDVLVKRGGKLGVLQRGVAGHPPGDGELRGKVVADGIGFRLLRRRPFGAGGILRNRAFQLCLPAGFQFAQGETVSGAQVRREASGKLLVFGNVRHDVRRWDLYAAAGRQRLADFAHAVGQGFFHRRHQPRLVQGVSVHIPALDVGVFFDPLRQPAEDVRRALVQFARARGIGHGGEVGDVLFLAAPHIGDEGSRTKCAAGERCRAAGDELALALDFQRFRRE